MDREKEESLSLLISFLLKVIFIGLVVFLLGVGVYGVYIANLNKQVVDDAPWTINNLEDGDQAWLVRDDIVIYQFKYDKEKGWLYYLEDKKELDDSYLEDIPKEFFQKNNKVEKF